MAELSLNRRNIAGFLNEVSSHGVPGIMGRVTLDAGQAAYFDEHCIDHPGVETTVAVGVEISKLIDFVLHFHDKEVSVINPLEFLKILEEKNDN